MIKLKDNTREIEIERRKKINKDTRALFLIPRNNIDITPRCKIIYLCEGFQSDNVSHLYIYIYITFVEACGRRFRLRNII